MNEKLLERKVKKVVEKKIGITIKFQTVYEKHNPDRLILLPGGVACFVEVKTTGKKLSPGQQLRKKQLEVLGFRVYVVDDEESLKEFEQALDNMIIVSSYVKRILKAFE